MDERVGTQRVLLDSLSSGPPFRVRLVILLVGLLALASFAYDARRPEKSFEGSFSRLIVAFVCIWGTGFRKEIFLSPQGVIRQTRGWFTRNEDVLRWEQIQNVTFAFRKEGILVFFEKGAVGWKVLYRRDDESTLLAVLKEHLPNIDVEIL